jgi:hypothetical protein
MMTSITLVQTAATLKSYNSERVEVKILLFLFSKTLHDVLEPNTVTVFYI